jgi:hypothetical protein
VCRVFIFKDTGVRPHLSVGLISVRQKGGLPGPPTRNPPSRIPRCPGALWKALMPGSSSGPKCFQALGPPPSLLQSHGNRWDLRVVAPRQRCLSWACTSYIAANST